ncbi:uncharacterized protein LOC108456170 [Gossypium arboreum]|uniref:CYP722 protein n=1 Tax=Gossypium arboreum TaxID=29729 RepID=A0ABR0PY83_GOSAR|nr:uncharacterized protein LOC108456170 [Gossypium arboreum]KAK5831708.1 hypothetical protein PVK06_015507 [Gossypium arboreum]
MPSFEFDNVKAEKQDALWRYKMERKLRMGLSFIGFLLVLFLLSWPLYPTLIPDTVEVAGDFLRYLVSTFNKPLFTFVLLNFIILAVFVLSTQNQTQKLTTTPDIYDEYVSSRRCMQTSAVSTSAPVTEETTVDKQIILVENAAALNSRAKPQRTTTGTGRDTVTETKRSLSPVKEQHQPTENRTVTRTKPLCSTTEMMNQKEYRRTRSMVSESRNQRPREFRRSETAMFSRELVVTDAEPPRKSMDEMSSEEFRSIVDSFIAEKKKTLMQENTAHYTRRKEKCMSIVVKN